jgi:hypothetical protein
MNKSLIVALLVTVAATAACTQAKAPTGNSSANQSPSTISSAASGPTDTTATDSVSASNTSATPSKSVSPTAAPGPVGAPACATSALKVDVLRGSGAAGHQFALLQFTNKSTSECSLTGFPGVVLLEAGNQLGKPAARSAKPVSLVALKPGKTAAATLTNDSTCNADNSDSVQVIVPNRTEKVVLPLRLRGCPLTVDPVSAS